MMKNIFLPHTSSTLQNGMYITQPFLFLIKVIGLITFFMQYVRYHYAKLSLI